jgi:hypothetical protein
VIADEQLEADRLKPIAREGVVLWLRTRSNGLKLSTLDALGRFKEAYVQVRAPVNAEQARLMARAPEAGIWVSDADLAGEGVYRLMPRRIAAQVDGPLDDARALALARAHVTELLWAPGPSADLLSLGRFRALPGRKVVRVDALSTVLPGMAATGCPQGSDALGFWLDARKAVPGKEWGWPAGCSRGSRVRVRFDVTDDALRWLYRQDAAVELEVDIQDNDEGAAMARALVDRLSAAVPGGRRK